MELNTKVRCDFVNEPLTEVIKVFSSSADLSFIPGPQLREAAAGGDNPGGGFVRRVRNRSRVGVLICGLGEKGN